MAVLLMLCFICAESCICTHFVMHALLLACIMEPTAVTQAELVSVDGERIKKFDVKAEGDALALGKRISGATLQVWQHLMLEQ